MLVAGLLGVVGGIVVFRRPMALVACAAIGTATGLAAYKLEEFVAPERHRRGHSYPGWLPNENE